MIKLEELKVNDEIFVVSSDGWGIEEFVVGKELVTLDLYPDPCEAVIDKDFAQTVTRNHEEYLFKTYTYAENKLMEIRLNLAKELLKSDKFIDKLFECATSRNQLNKYTESPIYELAIKLYKENIKG